jgi:Fic family protein
MPKLTNRQAIILRLIQQNPGIQNKDILAHFKKELGQDLGRVTIVREMAVLLKQNLIRRQGSGRNVGYFEIISNELLRYIDVEEYFSKDLDKRDILYKSFNFEIFKNLKNLFDKEESVELQILNNSYRERIKNLSPAIIKKEIERLTIDLSWKSSKIEGNTYSLLDTETLIKENKEAVGHKKEEAIMILNHKKALDFIFSKKGNFVKISIKDLENIHSLLIEGLGVSKGLRKNLVGITGTNYKPLDNQHQIKEAIEKTLNAINAIRSPLEKSLVASLLIAYIQPFEDGNKRTSRLLSDAILIAQDFCPLSFRSVEESSYKKAMIIFYETNNLSLFKELFVGQFKFAVANYFL